MATLARQIPFSPMDDAGAYRRALGHFTTGIAVVTAQSRGDWIGMTINSFSSVSDKDPLVFWRGNITKVDRNSLESIN